MGLVSGALIASLCGATVGYTITVASTVMDKRFLCGGSCARRRR